jgi:hypothetical protein
MRANAQQVRKGKINKKMGKNVQQVLMSKCYIMTLYYVINEGAAYW